MKKCDPTKVVITGLGITTSVGQGKNNYKEALWKGGHDFRIMERECRQQDTSFIGAEINVIEFPETFSKKTLRNASLSGMAAMATIYEAWKEAQLEEIDADLIGLIVGGSNVQQREQLLISKKYADKLDFIVPSYAFSFMDSDLCGMIAEQFGIKGLSYSIGGASASGQLAVIQAIQAIESGIVDVCIAVGSLMDISYLECQAFRNLGAMGTDRYAKEPGQACRPFDENRDGFIYGESCGVLVIESESFAKARGSRPYAYIAGYGVQMDANRNPNPDLTGEIKAIQKALTMSKLEPEMISYVNPHGSGSVIGDAVELHALKECKLTNAYINGTKSITGHGLSAAGAVELVTTILQMEESKLHPTRNLIHPIDNSFHWVKESAINVSIEHALNMSIGFGGINTALCVSKYK